MVQNVKTKQTVDAADGADNHYGAYWLSNQRHQMKGIYKQNKCYARAF